MSEQLIHKAKGIKTTALTIVILTCSLSLGSSVIAADDLLLERGTYLMESIVACGNCHTPKNPETAVELDGMAYAGSFVIEEPGVYAYAPNITMDVETGLGSWTDEEIIIAIRDGLRPDGTLIGPPMPSPFYATMSDYDVKAIVAYLRTVEPVKNVMPKSTYDIPLPPNYGPKVGYVAEIDKDDPIAYGEYLTHSLGHCTECHSPITDGQIDLGLLNAGGRIFTNIFGLGFTTVSRNITPHPTAGIGEWTDDEIKRAITEGVGRDGRELVKAMAFPYYQKIRDEDLDAMVAYLRSVPPLPVE